MIHARRGEVGRRNTRRGSRRRRTCRRVCGRSNSIARGDCATVLRRLKRRLARRVMAQAATPKPRRRPRPRRAERENYAVSARRYCCCDEVTGRSTIAPQNPIIISSQVWSPQRTSLVGSGLYLFSAELSKCAMTSMLGALRQHLRLGQLVGDLPVEVVLRHRQQRLAASVRIVRDVGHVLAADVHVRHQRSEGGVGSARLRFAAHFVSWPRLPE